MNINKAINFKPFFLLVKVTEKNKKSFQFFSSCESNKEKKKFSKLYSPCHKILLVICHFDEDNSFV